MLEVHLVAVHAKPALGRKRRKGAGRLPKSVARVTVFCSHGTYIHVWEQRQGDVARCKSLKEKFQGSQRGLLQLRLARSHLKRVASLSDSSHVSVKRKETVESPNKKPHIIQVTVKRKPKKVIPSKLIFTGGAKFFWPLYVCGRTRWINKSICQSLAMSSVTPSFLSFDSCHDPHHLCTDLTVVSGWQHKTAAL